MCLVALCWLWMEFERLLFVTRLGWGEKVPISLSCGLV